MFYGLLGLITLCSSIIYILSLDILRFDFESHSKLSCTPISQSLLMFVKILFPMNILLGSLGVIIISNPIYALIALIFTFLNTSIFLLSIQIQFLAFTYVIVYIGAISILILFVIMLFDLRSLKQSTRKIKDFSFLTLSFKLYFVFGLKFILLINSDIVNLWEFSTYINLTAKYKEFDLQYFLMYLHSDIFLFSNLFYSYYAYIFLLAGLILFVSMVGSIVLALSTTEPTQEKKLVKFVRNNSVQTEIFIPNYFKKLTSSKSTSLSRQSQYLIPKRFTSNIQKN